jgi:hypothetical protein
MKWRGRECSKGREVKAITVCCFVFIITITKSTSHPPFREMVTVRVKQCTVRDTTTRDCSTTAPLALVQMRLSVATALACHDTVWVPISCS